MPAKLSTEAISITPTPSQHLFSVWNGLCGNTIVCSGITLINTDCFSEEIFFSAWKRWLETSYELNIRVDYISSQSEPLILMLDDSLPSDNCFRFINREQSSIEYAVDEEIHKLLNADMDTVNKFNHCLCVIKFSENKYVVLLAVEHMLSDGLSVDVLLNRYLKLLDDQEKNDLFAKERYHLDKPLLDKYSNFREISSPFTQQYAEKVLSKRYFWNPNHKPLIHRKGRYKRLQKSLSGGLINNVNRFLSTQKTSLFPLLTSFFIESFFTSQPSENELLLQIPTHGRKFNNQILDKCMVGCFAQAFLLHTTRVEQSSQNATQRFNELQRYVLNCMDNEVDQLTARRNADSIKKSSLPTRLHNDAFAHALRKSMPTNVYFSFYGSSSLPLQYKHFALENYHLATTNLAGTLDVMVVQYNENIEVSFNYDSLFFNDETIEHLAETFEQHFNNVEQILDTTVEASNPALLIDIATQKVLIDCINKYSLETISEHDKDSHIEIDLGLDSLMKTRVLLDFLALTQRTPQDINREIFYSASTLLEMLNAVAIK